MWQIDKQKITKIRKKIEVVYRSHWWPIIQNHPVENEIWRGAQHLHQVLRGISQNTHGGDGQGTGDEVAGTEISRYSSGLDCTHRGGWSKGRERCQVEICLPCSKQQLQFLDSCDSCPEQPLMEEKDGPFLLEVNSVGYISYIRDAKVTLNLTPESCSDRSCSQRGYVNPLTSASKFGLKHLQPRTQVWPRSTCPNFLCRVGPILCSSEAHRQSRNRIKRMARARSAKSLKP